MKKSLAVIILSCAAFMLAACSGKSENVETAVDLTDTGAQAAPGDTDLGLDNIDEDADTETFEGIITAIDGSKITLQGDDGSHMSFDIGEAELFEDDGPILRGSYAEADYLAEDGADIYAAQTFIVLNDIEQQADIEGRDPMIYGSLQIMDTNELQILDDAGYERSFDNQMSREVSFTGIKAGDEVAVTYTGSLLDSADGPAETPYALKVVAVDALESEEALADYITGFVDEVYSDGVFTLITDALTLDVDCDPALIDSLDNGQHVKVYYSGQLSSMAVYAENVELID